MALSRERFIKNGMAFAAGSAAALGVAARVSARTSTVLDVAYAGAMTSVMAGPIQRLAAARLDLALQGRAQGASGLAQLIAGGSISPDVFISVTPGPMETVIDAGKALRAEPIARTAMVIAYSPVGRFTAEFRRAGDANAQAWWQVLEEPGVRFGRSNPLTDPQGRNIIFVMQLAAAYYDRPDLARRILGSNENPSQIFTEATVEARLQSGELDAASAYKIQPTGFGLPFIDLPPEIDLSDARRNAEYARASVTLGGKVYRPQPLVFYAAALNGASHPQRAAAFVKWLVGTEAQAVLRRYHYDPAGDAAPLHA